MTEIKPSDLMEWQGDENYSVDGQSLAEVLNHLLERIKRLEAVAGRCQCMNCVVIGV